MRNQKDKKKEMKEKAKNKKADITTSQIVMIILLVLGFAIIIFFIIQLKWGGQVNSQVCHESVVLRGTLPSVTQGYIPLKCMTDKVCITSSTFGSCAEFKDVKGVTKVKISSDRDKARKDIEKAITQEIYNCWTMMGQGKLSLFSQELTKTYGIGTVYPTCVLCSRIAFDKTSLDKTGADLSKIDVFEYMMSHMVPGKNVSYYAYLAGTSPAQISIENDISLTIPVDKDGKIVKIDEPVSLDLYKEKSGAGDADELGVLFMQISSPQQGQAAINAGNTILGVAIGSFLTAPKATIAGGKLVGKACTTGWGPVICGSILAAAGIYQQANVARNRAITAGYCGDVSIGTDARNGCSVVRTINYNADDISSYCSVIESIP
ncbi:hypothetical protein HYT26_00595 [Candidatus Pacearchaeota archaeon]|nr:hypothetical protein [Candidatus Pacearchaeota archaeon]